MYRGRIPHKWNRDRYDPEYLRPAPYAEDGGNVGADPVSARADSVSAVGADDPVRPPLGESEPMAMAAPSPPAAAEPATLTPAEAAALAASIAVERTHIAAIAKPTIQAEAPSDAEDEGVTPEAVGADDPVRPSPVGAALRGRPSPIGADDPVRPDATAPAGLISGKNAVLEALRSGQSVNRVLLAEGQTGAFVTEVIKKCRENGVPYQFLPKARLAKLAGPDHRGVACELSAFQYAEVEDMLEAARTRHQQPLLLLLDGVEDPHNLGAVMRTALCAGAHGVIIPKRRAAAFTATVAKTSAGASAYLPLARVANLSQTARTLQQAGLWLAAADMDGQTAWQADLRGPLALVLGGEGGGVSPLLKRGCDLTVSLPMSSPLGSLNVSAAAAALLYEIRRQREQ